MPPWRERSKESRVKNDLTFPVDSAEAERHAYNAAFHELGLRWHWNDALYRELTGACADAPRQTDANRCVRQYLETHQAHLLRAYDADFLVDLIVQKQTAHRRQLALQAPVCQRFDWAAFAGTEVGV